ncbi:MAG: hypothetical protein HW412_814 [Bacteroidetes bacterium]|nr:hypothetical protein [Bacteroidota bacterium]
MKNTVKYRPGPLLLAAMFAVFNIGIPVVVATCPMAKALPGGSCIVCYEETNFGSSSITTARNTSCCTTVIAAERSTNEFVQAKSSMSDLSKLLQLVVLPANVLPVPVPQSPVYTVDISSSPPAFVDIPIFTSSLLI